MSRINPTLSVLSVFVWYSYILIQQIQINSRRTRHILNGYIDVGNIRGLLADRGGAGVTRRWCDQALV